MADKELYFGRGAQLIGPYHPDEVLMITEEGWQQRFDALHVGRDEPVREQVYRIVAPDMQTAKYRLRDAQEKDERKAARA